MAGVLDGGFSCDVEMVELVSIVLFGSAVGIAIFWGIWPTLYFADLWSLPFGIVLLMFLGVSGAVFASSFLWSFHVEWHRETIAEIRDQGEPFPVQQRVSACTVDGLIRGHVVAGRRVKAYETHQIAGMKFTFAFVPWPTERFRIYILNSPSYGNRDAGYHPTHRLRDSALNCDYICIQVQAYPSAFEDARSIALTWAMATARYIKTGETFG